MLTVTSYDAATGGAVVNQIKYEYDGFGQVASDVQTHDGAVTTGAPKVAYNYADGSENTNRAESMTYPNGRVINFAYGLSDGPGDWLSRVESLSDLVLAGQYALYSYMGARTVVWKGYNEPGIEMSYIAPSGTPGGDAGDRYTGLDRFGRVVDRRWFVGPTDIDRFKYGYTPASLRQWRQNVVAATGQDEYYDYDGLYQVTGRQLGTLNSGKTGITGTPAQTEGWNYDPSGNWDNYTQARFGSIVVNQARTHDEVNQITTLDGGSWPIAYDAAGNMTQVPTGFAVYPGATLTWDAWNRLVRVQTGGSSSSSSSSSSGGDAGYDIKYLYDGLSRRTRQFVNAGPLDSEDLYWNLDWKCVETRATGDSVMKAQYAYGAMNRNELIFRDTGGTRRYVTSDAMLSTTSVTDEACDVRFQLHGRSESRSSRVGPSGDGHRARVADGVRRFRRCRLDDRSAGRRSRTEH